jgi:hypothetical protein
VGQHLGTETLTTNAQLEASKAAKTFSVFSQNAVVDLQLNRLDLRFGKYLKLYPKLINKT